MATKTVLAMAAALTCSLLAGGAWADQAPAAQPGASDARITQQVENKITTDFPNWAGRIQVTTQNGVVTLSGSAATVFGEQKMVEDAHSVSGVTRVRNEMRVV
jgi:osmotically-inducible protein OsmY